MPFLDKLCERVNGIQVGWYTHLAKTRTGRRLFLEGLVLDEEGGGDVTIHE